MITMLDKVCEYLESLPDRAEPILVIYFKRTDDNRRKHMIANGSPIMHYHLNIMYKADHPSDPQCRWEHIGRHIVPFNQVDTELESMLDELKTKLKGD